MIFNENINEMMLLKHEIALSDGAVEYTDCFSAKG